MSGLKRNLSFAHAIALWKRLQKLLGKVEYTGIVIRMIDTIKMLFFFKLLKLNKYLGRHEYHKP